MLEQVIEENNRLMAAQIAAINDLTAAILAFTGSAPAAAEAPKTRRSRKAAETSPEEAPAVPTEEPPAPASVEPPQTTETLALTYDQVQAKFLAFIGAKGRDNAKKILADIGVERLSLATQDQLKTVMAALEGNA